MQRYLNTLEAAEYINVSKSTLDKLRIYGGGPTFIRISKKTIRYSIDDLHAWMESQRQKNTSEYAA